MTEHCKHCGAELMHWPDIALAMESMIDVAPVGVKPMFRQAIDEILALRNAVSAADGLHAETLYSSAPAAKDRWMRLRGKIAILSIPEEFKGYSGYDPLNVIHDETACAKNQRIF